ncbi:N-acetylglucosamine kinase [Catellatospora bangladeshensis]|uniref:N-acetylglucosamine kinase n=1 Tax=Catellatospora bangladeshensis TaxID=310355 RepID=A0A8J3NJQ3_9ACTN|nr:BadF/BadG/BcrA/BcrD ATPase family protein [Catellatospora bangladeshensis]GIF81716.1 N-acetylglucosamine kinase [Catellatospora bangladeshensis]
MPDKLVLGLDIGGTSTRAVLASPDGHRLGTGRAGGGNPTTHGDAALTELTTAVRAALAGHDPADVGAAVLGMAGYPKLLADAVLRDAFEAAWAGTGLRCEPHLVSDVLVAYAAGTPDPDGTVVVAGTGAIAARVRGHRLDHVADGHGWLLGDLGSGYWLGREAVRAALRDLDRERPPGTLAAGVLTELLGTAELSPRRRDTAAALVQAVVKAPPIALARLAPLVLSCYDAADPAAVDLVRRAAAHLADTVAMVRAPGETTVLVRGGGLLTNDTPLAAELTAILTASWPGAAPRPAGDAAAAAAWLAALPTTAAPATLHTHLLTP